MLNDHLTDVDLAKRWNMSPNTLSVWRHKKIGCQYSIIAKSVMYKLSDVEEYENNNWYIKNDNTKNRK